jgi:hypothetical protein
MQVSKECKKCGKEHIIIISAKTDDINAIVEAESQLNKSIDNCECRYERKQK